MINLDIGSGCDVPYFWYLDLTNQLNNQKMIINTNYNHYFIRWITDIMMLPFYLINKKDSNIFQKIKTYLKIYNNKIIFTTLDISDPFPFFIDLFNNIAGLFTRTKRYIRYITKGE
ncbi:hypothetical protein HOD20_01710 [archaeon]|jgi:hypothetical protein|nr:hypothetical protein [Candidatus Woesearchaeota archaeon]MBT3464917.1 hypothetical protein [archaeon]MBT4351221.1 hypothetical protein [archaeon]MBT4647988.1 hypothetical protein [archaeon]MBT6822653.1 hypothetical protein [archaeon]